MADATEQTPEQQQYLAAQQQQYDAEAEFRQSQMQFKEDYCKEIESLEEGIREKLQHYIEEENALDLEEMQLKQEFRMSKKKLGKDASFEEKQAANSAKAENKAKMLDIKTRRKNISMEKKAIEKTLKGEEKSKLHSLKDDNKAQKKAFKAKQKEEKANKKAAKHYANMVQATE